MSGPATAYANRGSRAFDGRYVLQEAVEQIKRAVREILGEVASQIFLARIDKTLDEGGKDRASLELACTRIEKTVNLFIGSDEAKVIAKRCREIIERSA